MIVFTRQQHLSEGKGDVQCNTASGMRALAFADHNTMSFVFANSRSDHSCEMSGVGVDVEGAFAIHASSTSVNCCWQ